MYDSDSHEHSLVLWELTAVSGRHRSKRLSAPTASFRLLFFEISPPNGGVGFGASFELSAADELKRRKFSRDSLGDFVIISTMKRPFGGQLTSVFYVLISSIIWLIAVRSLACDPPNGGSDGVVYMYVHIIEREALPEIVICCKMSFIC